MVKKSTNVKTKFPKKLAKLEAQIERFGTVTRNGVTISIAKIPFEKVMFNPENPNVMDEKMEKALAKNMKKGYLEFAVVFYNKEDAELYCIDGEHRLKILHGEGETHPIVSLVEAGVSQLDAYSGAYTFNKFKGNISNAEVSKMISVGVKKYGIKKIQQSLGLQKYQVEELLLTNQATSKNAATKHLTNIKKIQTELNVQAQGGEIKATPLETMGQFFMVELPPDKHKYVMQTLTMMGGDTPTALYNVCRKARKKMKPNV